MHHLREVLQEIDAEGKIVDRTYDDNNWTLSETVISDRLWMCDRTSVSLGQEVLDLHDRPFEEV